MDLVESKAIQVFDFSYLLSRKLKLLELVFKSSEAFCQTIEITRCLIIPGGIIPWKVHSLEKGRIWNVKCYLLRSLQSVQSAGLLQVH